MTDFSVSGIFDNVFALVDCGQIYFSEYIEGSSNNKAVEIYNPTGSEIILTDFAQVKVYSNGSSSPSSTINLTGTIAPYGVFVLANTSANEDIKAAADQLSGALTHNGDDALELVYDGVTMDVFGEIGFDPGTAWGSGDTSTADHTLRRKVSIKKGDENGSDAFDPSIEWDFYPINTSDGLGSHTSDCQSATEPCPELLEVPANVSFEDSVCEEGCEISGGVIYAPGETAPEGAHIEYSIDGGTTWSSTLPVYNLTESMTIITRFVCNSDASVVSPSSEAVTTTPDVCETPETIPEITITNNICPSTDGSITANESEDGYTLEWATNPSGPWTTSAPAYTQTAMTVYARYVNENGCAGEMASEMTSPDNCAVTGDACF
ncbi:MAG: lamin tail domain-containing protein, partial [Acholeplasmataceae bacterium]|nr:lamin tail domain-containing protein [Acholeplasmataceae bacterium]